MSRVTVRSFAERNVPRSSEVAGILRVGGDALVCHCCADNCERC
jgi:hypothetical protein